MTRYLTLIAALIALCWSPPARATPPSFIALCYHNIEDADPDQNFVGVSTDKLIDQLSWLQRNDYHFVSLDDVLAARDGTRALPDKAVLLTFDDGFQSFYTRVFPVLKAFKAPAMLALVGAWLDEPAGSMVAFGDTRVPRDEFLTWDQVREVAKSGLVEIASHTYGLHKGTLANPQGNTEPAAVTKRFDAAAANYETEAAFRVRLDADMSRSAAEIGRETGHRPRAMVWPYGEHSQSAMTVAAANGMPITLTLDDGVATLDRLIATPRELVTLDPTLDLFVADLRTISEVNPQRIVQVDLDYVYDPDPVQQEKNLDRLVQRVQEEQISTIYLQAFADPTGTGLVSEVYFPNRNLPMRADLFNRVAWQLRTRALVRVYAWMPVLAINFDASVARVLAWNPKTGAAAPATDGYSRVSLFDPEARRRIIELYEDLAQSSSFEGVLFHDDAVLSDFEDASAPALAAYAKAGLPNSIEALRADPETLQRWTRFKSDALIEFTGELAAAARRYRSPLPTARNIYAPAVLDPASEAWFAQQLDGFLAAYDYTVIMAMPLMEGVPQSEAEPWLTRLVAAAAKHDPGLKRTIFELQSVDWRQDVGGVERAVPTAVLAKEMRLLAKLGALNFGYYPDDFIDNHPDAALLHRDFSLQSYPYRP